MKRGCWPQRSVIGEIRPALIETPSHARGARDGDRCRRTQPLGPHPRWPPVPSTRLRTRFLTTFFVRLPDMAVVEKSSEISPVIPATSPGRPAFERAENRASPMAHVRLGPACWRLTGLDSTDHFASRDLVAAVAWPAFVMTSLDFPALACVLPLPIGDSVQRMTCCVAP
jgi:hypothetical protein